MVALLKHWSLMNGSVKYQCCHYVLATLKWLKGRLQVIEDCRMTTDS
jgi:hypothetical protein